MGIPRNFRVKRNDPCPCASGKKYKKCCLIKSEESEKVQRDIMEKAFVQRKKMKKEIIKKRKNEKGDY